jgi:peroxiredoxin
LLSDVDRVAGDAYGVERSPDEPNPHYPKRISFLIDPDGVIARVYEVSDAGAHPEVVLEDLRRLTSTV